MTRWIVVTVIYLLAVITIVDRVAISSAKRDIASELALTDVQFGWVFAAFTIGYAILMAPSGWMADRFGPRRFLAAIVCIWSALTVTTGLVSGFASLIAVRLAFGLAEAGAYPAASRAIYAWLPVRERGRALGIMNAGSRFGAAIGLPIASSLIVAFGWRQCFLVLGAVSTCWAIGWFAWFRDDPSRHGSVGPRELEAIRRDRPAAPPARGEWRRVVFSKAGALLLFQYFASNFTFFLVYSWMLPHLQQHFGLDPVRAGIYAGLPMYCGTAAAALGGFAVDLLHRRGLGPLSRAIPAGAGLAVASIAVASSSAAGSAGLFVGLFSLAIFGLDFAVSPSWTVASDLGRENTGALSGAMNMMGSIGSFSCSVAFPYLLQATGRHEPFFVLAAGLNLAAAGCWVGLARIQRH